MEILSGGELDIQLISTRCAKVEVQLSPNCCWSPEGQVSSPIPTLSLSFPRFIMKGMDKVVLPL